jgi:N-acetylneuraminic acid mutarotase
VAGAVLDGRLFVFGGEGSGMGSGVFPNVEAYDPAADRWETLPAMSVPRHGFGAATLDGRIYLPGGATSQGFGPVDDHSVLFFE